MARNFESESKFIGTSQEGDVHLFPEAEDVRSTRRRHLMPPLPSHWPVLQGTRRQGQGVAEAPVDMDPAALFGAMFQARSPVHDIEDGGSAGMSDIGPNSQAAGEDEAQSAAPPQSRLVLVLFADEAMIHRAIAAIVPKLTHGPRRTVFRLALVARGSDGRISLKDLAEEDHGTIVAAALLGGVSGFAGGPLGATLGAAAGALVGWSAELFNEEAVTAFALHDWSALAPGRRAILAEVSDEAASSFEDLMAANGGTSAGAGPGAL